MTLRLQLMCGAIAGVLFTLVVLVEGALRNGYSWIRHPVSSLAIGPDGWMQSVTFVATGLLVLTFAYGLRRVSRAPGDTRSGPRFVGLCALGLIGAGLFTTDPFSGYPLGTPDRPVEFSPHGILHMVCASTSFLALAAACFVYSRQFTAHRRKGWRAYSIVSALGLLGGFFLFANAIHQVVGLVEVGGLLERVALGLGMAWLALVARAVGHRPSRV